MWMTTIPRISKKPDALLVIDAFSWTLRPQEIVSRKYHSSHTITITRLIRSLTTVDHKNDCRSQLPECTDWKVHFSNGSLSLKPDDLINRFLHYIRNRHQYIVLICLLMDLNHSLDSGQPSEMRKRLCIHFSRVAASDWYTILKKKNGRAFC